MPYEPGLFAFILASGGESHVYIFTPDHMKQVGRIIAQKVEEYEKVNGVLEGKLPSEKPQRSFISPDELRPGGEGVA